MAEHSYEHAPSDEKYQRLLEATTDLKYPFNVESRWILIAAGKLGMRGGEICHMRISWINWEREQIEIPSHDPCDQGRTGEECGDCRDRASEYAETHDVDFETALNHRWNPKTPHAQRAIPFGYSDELLRHVKCFWADRDVFPKSKATVNRRVDRVLETAGYPVKSSFPHALRARAATKHLYRGVPLPAVMSILGWKSIEVARKYLRLSGAAAAQALDEAYAD